MSSSNVSTDAIWEICRSHNAYLVKRRQAGGVQFSRDPLNLTNEHSRKYDGFINDKAVGIIPNDKGGVKLLTKKASKSAHPASNVVETIWGQNKTSRRTYRGIANQVAKNRYRPDLRAEAVARASAIRQAQRPKKEAPKSKLRGAKARKAAEVKITS